VHDEKRGIVKLSRIIMEKREEEGRGVVQEATEQCGKMEIG
jgi:hypothetical protein